MKYISFTGLMICLLLCMISCKKAPLNSNIEGMWMLREFTVRESNETVKCSRLYYSITRMVTEISEKQGNMGYGTYISRTEYRDSESKLVLKDFKVRGETSDTGVNAPIDDLRHYGINSQKETVFDIVHCDGKKMTLQSYYARLELEKF